MGGIHTIFKRGALFCAVFVLCLGFQPGISQASGGLDLARDNISSFLAGQPNVYHDIFFVIPPDAQQIRPTDYILLDFPNYTNVQPPNSVLGTFSTPTITVVGHTIEITNMVALPGSGLTFPGITANNPQTGQSNEVVAKIAEDANGTIVHNEQTIIPSTGGTSVTVTANVQSPLSSLVVSGYTSPGAFTSIVENQDVLGTGSADLQGFFSFNINALNPGNHTFGIYSTDGLGLTTSQLILTLFLLPSQITTASGLLLSSTISLNKTAIDPGDTITANGTAKPNSQINIFLEAPLRSYTANTDASGAWSYTLPGGETQSLAPGQYQVYTVVQDAIGNQSIVSPTLNFTVNSPDTGNPPPACDISHGDLNCNGVTNLVDFSILLFHWHTNHRVADINNDGQVNLTDFSIMMFYYTR